MAGKGKERSGKKRKGREAVLMCGTHGAVKEKGTACGCRRAEQAEQSGPPNWAAERAAALRVRAVRRKGAEQAGREAVGRCGRKGREGARETGPSGQMREGSFFSKSFFFS